MPPASRKNGPRQNTPVKKTLDRVLSRAGAGSRTDARKWISDGRVKVDGKVVTEPETWIDPARQNVTLDGRPVRPARQIYLLLYKPKGYLTTFKDNEGRPTIYDLIPQIKDWVFPAGRLDLDTSGLLILTNDTAFGDYITSPESHVPKTYLVKASTVLSEDQLERLRSGIELADGPTRPAIATRLRDSGKYTHFEMTITEGRNRQVRRMVEALGAKVLKLVRTQIGSIQIAGLEIGKYRELTNAEVDRLAPGIRSRTSAAQPERSAPDPASRSGKGSPRASLPARRRVRSGSKPKRRT